MTKTIVFTFGLAFGGALFFAGCGNSDQCSPDTACEPGSANHYRFCNGGHADDCYYEMADHTLYHCSTCGDCSAAQSLAEDWCSAQPARSTTTSSSSSSSGLGSLCSGAGTCPSGGSYQFCASSTDTNCGYSTSDGHVYKCNSCTDCTAASQQAASWCESGNTGNTTTTTTNAADAACLSSSSCSSCCAANHSSGVALYEQIYTACACPYCGPSCANGCSSTTTDGTCRSCIDMAAQQNCNAQLSSSCSANADCQAFITCAQKCPQ